MKIRMLCLALALLMIAAASYADPTLLLAGQYGFVMTKNCSGGDAIPDGTPVWFYQNWTNTPAPTCPDPECTFGLLGQWNLNNQPMNGAAVGMVEGQFYFETAFKSAQDYPPAPNNVYYFLVRYAFPTYEVREGDSVCTYHHETQWKSRTITAVSGNMDIDLSSTSDWTCSEVTVKDGCVYDPDCVPTLNTVFHPAYPAYGLYNFHECVTLCVPNTHTVCVGPLPKQNRMPHGFFLSGCAENTPCYPHAACDAATGWMTGGTPPGALVFTWREMPVGSGLFYYCATIVPGAQATNGCGCIFVDWIEPVDMGDVDVVAMDKSVKVSWNTLAETDFNAFEIWRDNVKVTTINANGGAAGHNYEYVDAVDNGRTYKYELKAVDLDGASAVVYTESVTPSFENAVVTEYALHQNYPNPFNPSTRIAFDVVNSNPVTLTIYNATGQEVATLLNNVSYTTGRYNINFDATNLTSGLYFYTVKIGNEFTATKKMLLVK